MCSERHRTNAAHAPRRSFTRRQMCAFMPRGRIMRASLAPAEISPTTLRQWRSRCAAGRMRAMPIRQSAEPGSGGSWSPAGESVSRAGEPAYPERCPRLDYEGEIAIVLGERGVDLKPAQL